MLYAYCAEHGVPHRRLGKLVVARTDADVPRLKQHMDGAQSAGVDDVHWLDAADARAMEPNLSCQAAYLSRSSGIVDSHALMLAYQAELEAHGGCVAMRAPVVSADASGDRIRIEVGGSDPMRLECRTLVNAAGHGAPALARNIAGLPADAAPKNYYRRGVYFAVGGPPPFRRLVYPIHGSGGLDIHAVIDLAGAVRFGPDAEWIDRIDYTVDPGRAAAFYPAVRSFWPGLPDGALQPAYAGIRPSIAGPGEGSADFAIKGPRDHGVPGLVNLFGIESPGLTASLAIGDYVASLLAK